MTLVAANEIHLEYDEFGEQDAPAILLIMGLGAQMIWWDEGFCRQLAGRGYRVIRFDNRDIGLSTKLDDALPEPGVQVLKALAGKGIDAAYTLREMAADAVALLDALGVRRAHFVGASMGGMIAQRAAIHFPERVITLTSIMSTTGNPSLPPATPEAGALLTARYPDDPDAVLEHRMNVRRILRGGGFPSNEERLRGLIVEEASRSTHRTGQPRQYLAVLADGDRSELLRQLEVPTLVIHGEADPLIRVEAGIDTAENIPGARLVTIAGMGHEMPEGAWPILLDAIDQIASRRK